MVGGSRVEFRILGPLEVQAERGPVPIPGIKPRALLAILVGRVGQAISTDELIELLWDGEPRGNARRILHSYVSQLRRALHPLAPGRERSGLVVTRAPGYQLDVPPEAVDAFRFERLVAEAREERSDPARAARLLQAALALWRGPALADLPAGMVGHGMVSRLEEARFEALEERIDADLALGRHAEVVGELAWLADRHPLRERLQAQRMLALYRCGRQIDALGAYQRARTALIEENGLEPGAMLVDLQQAILRHDPGLSPPSPDRVRIAEPDRGRRRRDQLPARLEDFTGRQTVIAELERLMGDGHPGRRSAPVVVLTGPPGVGKSTLAVELAHRLRSRYHDGQLWASLGGAKAAQPDLSATVGAFLRALGVTDAAIPPGLDQQAALYRSLLARQRVLVVLDGAAGEAQVRSLLPGNPAAAVLITASGRLSGLEGARRVEVDALSPAGAVELLNRIVGPGRVAAELDEAIAVARLCDRLPLAVRTAAVRLAVNPDRSIAWLRRRLADEHRRLDELAAGDLSLRVSFQHAYGRLGDRERRAFRRLGRISARELDAGTAAGALGTGRLEAEDLLDRLADASLLRVARRGPTDLVWSWPGSLLRLFARELAADEAPAPDPAPGVGPAAPPVPAAP